MLCHRTALVRVLQRHKTNSMCVYKIFILRTWSNVIVEVGKSKVCRVGWQVEDIMESDAAVRAEGCGLKEFPLPWEFSFLLHLKII